MLSFGVGIATGSSVSLGGTFSERLASQSF